MEDQFIEACKDGDIVKAKILYNLGANINAENDCAFQWSCRNGHKEIAEWLYSLGETNRFISVNIHAENDYAFRYSCKNGHKEIAEWLYNLGETNRSTSVNIHAENDYAFRYSCENGHKK